MQVARVLRGRPEPPLGGVTEATGVCAGGRRQGGLRQQPWYPHRWRRLGSCAQLFLFRHVFPAIQFIFPAEGIFSLPQLLCFLLPVENRSWQAGCL